MGMSPIVKLILVSRMVVIRYVCDFERFNKRWVCMDRSELRMTLKTKGIAATKPRVLLLDILGGINAPISVQQLYQNHSDKFALSTLYRVVNDLSTAGILDTFTSPDQNIWIEIKSEGGHHHHLYCESCKTVIDIEMDDSLEESISKLREQLSQKYNITIVDHSFELYGKCSGNVHCACNLDD